MCLLSNMLIRGKITPCSSQAFQGFEFRTFINPSINPSHHVAQPQDALHKSTTLRLTTTPNTPISVGGKLAWNN